jgi:hypothetical protein
MTGKLTIWIDSVKKISGNALSGYQESNLGEIGDNLVHNGSFSHPGPGLLDYTRQIVKITSDWKGDAIRVSTLTRDYGSSRNL